MALVIGTAVELLRVRADLNDGKDALVHLDLDTIRAHGIRDAIGRAVDEIDAADRRARKSPFLRLASVIPVVGDQVTGVREVTALAGRLGERARVSGDRIAGAVDDAGGDASARVALLDVVVDELDQLEAFTAGLTLEQRGGLVGPLRDVRRDVERSLEEVPDRFAPLRDQVTALRSFLDGPTQVLVVVGNNAEMRAGAGMPLSAGLAAVVGGNIELGPFKSTVSEMASSDPALDVDVSPELRQTYPRWNLGRDFPESAVVSRFPITAPWFAALAENTQGWQPTAVVHVDAMALAELLGVVGEIVIDGVSFTEETAPQLVLNQPYLDFDGADERSDRLDAQSQLAGALFTAIEERDVDLFDLVAALQRAAAGRHLLLWAADPDIEALFTSFGAGGNISPFHTLVSFLNTGANKLDFYLRPTIEVTAEPVETGQWKVELTATVHNPDDVARTPAIDGVLPELRGGTHRTLLLVQLPRAASGADIPGETVSEFGTDNGSIIIGARFVIGKGDTHTATVVWYLPRELNRIAVMPSARVAPVPWTVNGAVHHDDVPFVASFGDFPLSVIGGTDPAQRRDRVLLSIASLTLMLAAALLFSALRRVHAPGVPRRLLGPEPGGRATSLARLDVRFAAGAAAVAAVLAVIAVLV